MNVAARMPAIAKAIKDPRDMNMIFVVVRYSGTICSNVRFYLAMMERKLIEHIVEGLAATLKEAKRKRKRKKRRRVPSGMLYYMDYTASGSSDGGDSGGGDGGGG